MVSGKYHKVLERLGKAEPTTVDEVKAILANIRFTNGYASKDYLLDLKNLEPENQDGTLCHLEELRETKASFTKSVSEQLYESKYRFLYELIQNADDSVYSDARGASKLPFARFKITPDKFIVETNEDGFSRANVKAICATGQSSKKASATNDHIGEKGFGFKSVFSIAEEVHIQSGLWSFRFEHQQGDNGLGMITPLDAEAVALPQDVTTRITLSLASITTANYGKLLEAVANVPETTVFFLQRLRQLHIHMTDLDARVIITRFEKADLKFSMPLVQLRRYQQTDGRAVDDESLYRCFTHVIEHMPGHACREDRKSARVDLAFPVDTTSKKPKLNDDGHHIFAYLPLQRLQQIKFLIQSDFVTTASRESVTECAWNDEIFKGVAKTFAMAVDSFTKDNDPLRYSWLEYLPVELSDDRWKALCPLTTEELARRPVLQTRQGRFKQPEQLLLLPENMLHDGEPILEDLPDDVYLAPNYKPYKSKIKSLGVRHADLTSMVKRLEADIMKPHSRLKTTHPSDPWHAAFASMFLTAWADKSPAVSIQKRLKELAIMPLQDRHQWAGAAGQSSSDQLQKVYLSDIEGVSIPGSIGLRLLDTDASSNATRRAFYMALGINKCPHDLVVKQIRKRYSGFSHSHDVLSHLRYLFYSNEDPELIWPWISVPTTLGSYVNASSNLYFPSAGKDDLHQLLIDQDHEKLRDTVVFLHEPLMDLETGSTNDNGVEWRTWLKQATCARYYPSLTQGIFEVKLSPALELVHKYNSQKFLRALKAHWKDYEKDASKIEADLRALRVRCMNAAGGPSQKDALENTYLPTASVIDRVLELGLSPDDFPILCLPGRHRAADKPDSTARQEWRFLEDFGVRHKPDLDFYKRALETVRTADQDPDFETLEDIYTSMADLATASDHDDLCNFFLWRGLWIPSSKSWEGLESCTWRGPSFLRYSSVLDPHYGHDPKISRFFQNTLDVKDTSIEDVLYELECRCYEEGEGLTSLPVASEIYQYLWEHASGDNEWEMVMKTFQSNACILGTNNTWYDLEECVWQTPFLLSGYHDLSTTYPQLESFFVDKLEIKKVTSSMLVDEIEKMVKQKTPEYDMIRSRLINVGMILTKTELDKATKDSLQSLSKRRFLPRRHTDGTPELIGISEKYAIADHSRYASAFSKDDILLDFLVEEVQIMNVMFEYLGIQKHYLSSLVVEESNVEGDVEEDDSLSKELQDKAYALFCCAAKYKSVKAFRGEHALFETLSKARVLNGNLATRLVIDDEDLGLDFKVQSDRVFLHHDLAEGHLKLYVPEDPKQRHASYLSQLPMLLAGIMKVNHGARHDISVIIGSSLGALDDVLLDLDISSVSWIEKPVLDLLDNEDGSTSSLESHHVPNAAHSGMRRRASPASSTRPLSSSEATLVDYAAASSRQAGSHSRVIRSSDQANIDRHNGALGEAFVFEMLSDLGLTNFTRDNWRSNIRGELSDYPEYAGITNWIGRETADIVYEDRTGELTEWLEGICTGGFPDIDIGRNFEEQPLEYYFEVKSTPGACDTNFFLSAGQYKRMHNMAVQTGQEPKKLYVIVRVFDLLSEDKGWEIFVDPVRLKGTHLKFEAEGWIGKTL